MTTPATDITLPPDKFDTNMKFVRPKTPPTRVPLDKLAVLPGFNTRVKDADYNERVAGIAASIVANGFFDDKPFAVTMLPNDDTIYIFDGEHRLDATKQSILDGVEFLNGLPVAWAAEGATVADLTIHLAHGNAGEKLNMVEMAAVVRRLQGLGMSKEEIARELGYTARHIDNLFVIANSNQTIKKAVATGQIAGAEAVKMIRKHGSTDAATKITEAIKEAAERGKRKATPKTMNADAPLPPKTKTVQMSLNFPVGKTMGEMLKAMATEIREFVEFDKETDVISADALIRFSVNTIDREATAEAEKKRAEKAAAAAERLKAKEAKLAEREAAAKKKAAEKAAADKKAAAEKAAKEKKAVAEAAKKAKAASGGKAAGGAQKPAKGSKGTKAATPPATPANPPAAPESPPLSDDSMGGL